LGLIDLIAEMLKLGFIDKTGRLINQETCNFKMNEEIRRRMIKDEKNSKFLLAKGMETENGNPIFSPRKISEKYYWLKRQYSMGLKYF